MIDETFLIKPVAKQRPRLARGGFCYTPKETVIFERSLARMVKTRLRLIGPLFLVEHVCIKIVFSFKKPKTSKLTIPRGDIDNYCKSVLDALNGVVWADDKNVCVLMARKKFDDFDGLRLTLWVDSEEKVCVAQGA